MRSLYFFLLLSGTALAQGSARRDSVPTEQAIPSRRMPTVRPQNEFYRRSGDNPNVVRATLDNMPVWMSEVSSVQIPTKGKVPRRRKQR